MINIIYTATLNQFKNEVLIDLNKKLFEKGIFNCLFKFTMNYLLNKKSYGKKILSLIFEILVFITENPNNNRESFPEKELDKLMQALKYDEFCSKLLFNIRCPSLESILKDLNSHISEPQKILEYQGYYKKIINICNYVSKPLSIDYSLFIKYKFNDLFLSVTNYIFLNMKNSLVIGNAEFEYENDATNFCSKSIESPKFIAPTQYSNDAHKEPLNHYYPQSIQFKNGKISDFFDILNIILNHVIYSSISCNLDFCTTEMISGLLSFVSDHEFLNRFKKMPRFLLNVLMNLSIFSK